MHKKVYKISSLFIQEVEHFVQKETYPIIYFV